MSELETADNRNIMVIREKVQLAKWIASKLIPMYGDKQEIKQDTNITIQWTTPNNKEINVTPGAEEIGITQHK
jgi:phosphatidate phosphatase PAH1